MAMDKKAQAHPIGAEDTGVVEQGVDEDKEVAEWEILVEEIEDQVGEEEEHLDQPDLTRWHAIGAGFVPIWPVTVPNPEASREEVAKIALPEEYLPDPGKKAHKGDDVEVVRCDSGPSMCCTMKTGIHIPWMMQVNCTSPSNSHRMLMALELRWKKKKVQKTKKDLCECGC